MGTLNFPSKADRQTLDSNVLIKNRNSEKESKRAMFQFASPSIDMLGPLFQNSLSPKDGAFDLLAQVLPIEEADF